MSADPTRGFEALLTDILFAGEGRPSRTGIRTRSLFAPDPLRYDLSNDGLALITSKKVPWKMATAEFLWMLSGSTSVEELADSSQAMAHIWENWIVEPKEDRQIGPTYGAQWRNAGGTLLRSPISTPWGGHDSAGIDQLAETINLLLTEPDTRRALVSLWSVPELTAMGIEPCMVVFHFSRRGPDFEQLDLHVYQRSADMMLGVPFDLYQASLLTHLVARELSIAEGSNVQAGFLTWSAGDVHLYENQLEPARLQLKQMMFAEPMRAKVVITAPRRATLLDGTLLPEHINVTDYNPEPAITGGAIAV